MKVTARDQGDSSTGIQPAELVVQWPYELDDPQERADAKKMVAELYEQIGVGIGRVTVLLEGECEFCGYLEGHSARCPTNLPEGDESESDYMEWNGGEEWA